MSLKVDITEFQICDNIGELLCTIKIFDGACAEVIPHTGMFLCTVGSWKELSNKITECPIKMELEGGLA